MPLWLKIACSAFLAVLVPVYWRKYGPGNFLWFSDIALFLIVAALWLESPLLAGMAAVSVLLLELVWNLDLLVRLLTGRRWFGLTDYMFDARLPLPLRLLSLFHVPMPPLLVWMLWRLGYDPRALPAQVVLAWLVLPATYLLTRPDKNVNWVHGLWGERQTWMPPLAWLAALMVAYPLLVYLPTHFLLQYAFPAPRG